MNLASRKTEWSWKLFKVGMVELGLAANSHFQGHVTHPHAEEVAICDMDIENADNFSQHNNGNT